MQQKEQFMTPFMIINAVVALVVIAIMYKALHMTPGVQGMLVWSGLGAAALAYLLPGMMGRRLITKILIGLGAGIVVGGGVGMILLILIGGHLGKADGDRYIMTMTWLTPMFGVFGGVIAGVWQDFGQQEEQEAEQ